MKNRVFIGLLSILIVSTLAFLGIITKEVLKNNFRRKTRENFQIAENFNSEKIRVTFDFVKHTLFQQVDKKSQQGLSKIQQLEEKLFDLEAKLKDIHELLEELIVKKWSFTKVFRSYLVSKKHFNNFLATKTEFETASEKVISFFSICNTQNVELSDLYERKVAEEVLRNLNDPDFPFPDKLNFITDEFSKLKGEFDSYYQRKNEEQLIKNLKKQKVVLAELLLVLYYGKKLWKLKTFTFPEKLKYLEERVKLIKTSQDTSVIEKHFEAISEQLRVFNKEFFMSDVLLTYTRAKGIIKDLNAIDKKLSTQIEVVTFLELNFDILMNFYDDQLFACNLFLKEKKGVYKDLEEEVFDLENQYKSHLSGGSKNLESFQLLEWAFTQCQRLKSVSEKIFQIKNQLIQLGNKRIVYDERLKNVSNIFLLSEQRIKNRGYKFNTETKNLRNKIKQGISFVNNLRVMAHSAEDIERISSSLETLDKEIPLLLIQIYLADILEFLTFILSPLRSQNSHIRSVIQKATEEGESGEFYKALYTLEEALNTIAS